MADQVVHDTENSRYALKRGDQVLGFTEYTTRPGAIVFVHTEIDPEVGERGLGTQLVAGALDDVRANSSDRVVALCPFVRAFLEKHPEYQDLTAR